MNARYRARTVCLGIAAAVCSASASAQQPLTPAQIDILRYTYSEFPRQLACADAANAAAQRALVLSQRRVASYRPFRSIGTYGATYSADQAAQYQLRLAEQTVEFSTYAQADVWRERQSIVASLLLEMAATEAAASAAP